MLIWTEELKMKFVLTVLTALSTHHTCQGLNKLQEKYHWSQIDFNFENDATRQKALEDRDFIPENNIPFGVEVWKDKVFITIPRRNPGVPATLNYVDLNSNISSPLLTPYPDWDSNKPTVGRITSTYRTNTDTCDRLWTIDTGSVVDFEGKGDRIQPPSILIFNLKTNKVIRSHRLKSASYACDSAFTNIFPDIRDSCEDAYAYAVDPASNGLLVYSFRQDDTWRKTHPYFNPDPFQMNYQIGDLSFQWDDGLFGFALSEIDKYGHRTAFLHPMSSLYEFIIDTEPLKNSTSSLQNLVKIAAVKSATFQAAAAAYDQTSKVLFYSLVNKNGIGCWNTRNQNMDIVAADNTTMVYSSDVKVDRNGNLWTISNRLPVILYANRDSNSQQANYRVFTAPVHEAIKNTGCDTATLFSFERYNSKVSSKAH